MLHNKALSQKKKKKIAKSGSKRAMVPSNIPTIVRSSPRLWRPCPALRGSCLRAGSMSSFGAALKYCPLILSDHVDYRHLSFPPLSLLAALFLPTPPALNVYLECSDWLRKDYLRQLNPFHRSLFPFIPLGRNCL